jgi:uncharacterized protein YkwD
LLILAVRVRKYYPAYAISHLFRKEEELVLSTIAACAASLLLASGTSAPTQTTTASQASAQTESSQSSGAKPAAPKAEVKADAMVQPHANAAPKLELLAIEQRIVDYTNAERARYGLPAFVVDPNLMATARQHCSWMATYRQLVHTRMGVAENIAMGQPNTQEVVRCWMNSSGHRANILSGNRRIGVAAYQTPEGTIYWCQQFTP